MKHLEYVTKGLTRWDLLADEFYGDPMAYPHIMEANLAFVGNVTLPMNTTIYIPILKEADIQKDRGPSQESIPPWK